MEKVVLIYNEELGKEVPAYDEIYARFDSQVATVLAKNSSKEDLLTMIDMGLNPVNSNTFVTDSREKYEAFTDENGKEQPAGVANVNISTSYFHEVLKQHNEVTLNTCLNYIHNRECLLNVSSFSNYVYTEPEGGMPDYYIPQHTITIIEDLYNAYNEDYSEKIKKKIRSIMKKYYREHKDLYDGKEYFPDGLRKKLYNLFKEQPVVS
jgi:hypothetical protein